MKKSNFILIFATILLLCGCTREKIKMRGTVKDYEGNIYYTIRIGNQVWMKENMRTRYFADGTPLLSYNQNSTEPSYASKGLDEAKYNGIAAQYKKDPQSKYTQGVCPNGWHLPSVSEWQELVNYYKEHPEIWNYDGVETIPQALTSKDFDVDQLAFSLPLYGYVYGLQTASGEMRTYFFPDIAVCWAEGYTTNYPENDILGGNVAPTDTSYPYANALIFHPLNDDPKITSANDRHYCSVRCVKDR